MLEEFKEVFGDVTEPEPAQEEKPKKESKRRVMF